jgi:hypothetical protein
MGYIENDTVVIQFSYEIPSSFCETFLIVVESSICQCIRIVPCYREQSHTEVVESFKLFECVIEDMTTLNTEKNVRSRRVDLSVCLNDMYSSLLMNVREGRHNQRHRLGKRKVFTRLHKVCEDGAKIVVTKKVLRNNMSELLTLYVVRCVTVEVENERRSTGQFSPLFIATETLPTKIATYAPTLTKGHRSFAQSPLRMMRLDADPIFALIHIVRLATQLLVVINVPHEKNLIIETPYAHLPDKYAVQDVYYHSSDNNADTNEAKWLTVFSSRYEPTFGAIVPAFERHKTSYRRKFQDLRTKSQRNLKSQIFKHGIFDNCHSFVIPSHSRLTISYSRFLLSSRTCHFSADTLIT